MNKLLLIMLVSLGIIGMVSAALVPYLSNEDSLFFKFSSPLSLNISGIPEGEVYGGSDLAYQIKVKNNLNKTINGTLVFSFINTLGNVSCSDLDAIGFLTDVKDVNPFSSCYEEQGMVRLTKVVSYNPLAEEVYYGYAALNLNIEPTTYEIKAQVMNLI